ncbi:hypothetical protein ACJX0J_032357 [Zea mays]
MPVTAWYGQRRGEKDPLEYEKNIYKYIKKKKSMHIIIKYVYKVIFEDRARKKNLGDIFALGGHLFVTMHYRRSNLLYTFMLHTFTDPVYVFPKNPRVVVDDKQPDLVRLGGSIYNYFITFQIYKQKLSLFYNTGDDQERQGKTVEVGLDSTAFEKDKGATKK